MRKICKVKSGKVNMTSKETIDRCTLLTVFDKITTNGLGNSNGHVVNSRHGRIKNAIVKLFIGCELGQSVCNVQIYFRGQGFGIETNGAQRDARKDKSIVRLPRNMTFPIEDDRRKGRTRAKQYTALWSKKQIEIKPIIVDID